MAVHRFSDEGQKIISFIESTVGIQLNSKNSKILSLLEADVLKSTNVSAVPKYNGALTDYYAELSSKSVDEALLGLYESTMKLSQNPEKDSDTFAKAIVLARGLNEFAYDSYRKYGLNTLINLAKQGL